MALLLHKHPTLAFPDRGEGKAVERLSRRHFVLLIAPSGLPSRPGVVLPSGVGDILSSEAQREIREPSQADMGITGILPILASVNSSLRVVVQQTSIFGGWSGALSPAAPLGPEGPGQKSRLRTTVYVLYCQAACLALCKVSFRAPYFVQTEPTEYE